MLAQAGIRGLRQENSNQLLWAFLLWPQYREWVVVAGRHNFTDVWIQNFAFRFFGVDQGHVSK